MAMTHINPSRGITDISYDRFGNPLRITYSNGAYTENVYSASGEKLKTLHSTNVTRQSDPSSLFDDILNEFSLESTDAASTGVTGTSTTEYRGNLIYRDGKLDMVLFSGGYATVSGSAVTFHYYTQDYLGNNRAVINGSTGAIEQTVAYYPYGGIIADLGNPTGGQPYKFGGKELITANGLNEYDFGARQYYSAIPGFTSIDPCCEDYYPLSPYLYCGNNPVNAIDPDGRSTWVTDMGNGLYQVIGGDLNDDDLNIYVYQKDEEGNYTIRGKSIGQTTSITSFYDSGDIIGQKGYWAKGAIIDTKDQSGEEFLTSLINENPSLFDDYAINAQNGGKYDFKTQGDANNYRGMPLGVTKKGIPIYTSARDIGNIAAGYIAAINGLPWFDSRICFDGYQSLVKGGLAIEGISSQNAQFYGWTAGKISASPFQQIVNFLRSCEKGKTYIIIQSLKWLIGK